MSAARGRGAPGPGRSSRHGPALGELAQRLVQDLERAAGYEALRSGLLLSTRGESCKTLLVTSTQPDEGKTTVAIYLALAMRLAGERVLLVDADLHRPAVHGVVGGEQRPGFGDLLLGACEATDAIQSHELPAPGGAAASRLDVVVAGDVSGAAVRALASPRLPSVLKELGTGYDAVVLDSPPVLSVNDPVLLAPAVDGVLLVIGTGQVDAEAAQRAVQRLEAAGAHILGAVLNRFDDLAGSHPYRGYAAEPRR